MDIFFLDQKHRESLVYYLENLNQIHPNGSCDPYYLSALYILTMDDEFRSKSRRYIVDGSDGKESGIYFERMSKQDFSSGYRDMLNLAWNLFNYSKKMKDIASMICRLDGKCFQVVIQAIFLRKWGANIKDIKENAEIYK